MTKTHKLTPSPREHHLCLDCWGCSHHQERCSQLSVESNPRAVTRCPVPALPGPPLNYHLQHGQPCPKAPWAGLDTSGSPQVSILSLLAEPGPWASWEAACLSPLGGQIPVSVLPRVSRLRSRGRLALSHASCEFWKEPHGSASSPSGGNDPRASQHTAAGVSAGRMFRQGQARECVSRDQEQPSPCPFLSNRGVSWAPCPRGPCRGGGGEGLRGEHVVPSFPPSSMALVCPFLLPGKPHPLHTTSVVIPCGPQEERRLSAAEGKLVADSPQQQRQHVRERDTAPSPPHSPRFFWDRLVIWP